MARNKSYCCCRRIISVRNSILMIIAVHLSSCCSHSSFLLLTVHCAPLDLHLQPLASSPLPPDQMPHPNSSSDPWNSVDDFYVRRHPLIAQPYDVGELTLFPRTREAGAWRKNASASAGKRRELGGGAAACGRTGNPIDDCWRCERLGWWARDRKKLADCGIGFGRRAVGGKEGGFYVVTDSSDDDPVHPVAGTLRHAVIQAEPLWIVFSADMTLVLRQELLVSSHKTIDGRGHDVHIAYGACITLHSVTNVIVHGIHVHDCKPAGNAVVRDSPTHAGWRTVSDGDGISLFAATDVWVDHVSLSRCTDGLLDAIMGSTRITVSNCHFSYHDKVMLLGHSDSYVADKAMKVTIAFNHFGEGLIQRMPRCRHGFFEIVNNDYTHWQMYAIGGSAAPTIDSKGNRFTATRNPYTKDVTMRMNAATSTWQKWNWHSEGDLFLNGAFFTPSGSAGVSTNYLRPSTIGPRPSSQVGIMTARAGALNCRRPYSCI